jgi:hydroxymethylbilane synthase
VTEILQGIDHAATHLAIRAERELQRLLAGDCALPVGVRTTLSGGTIRMKAILFGAESEPPRQAEAEAGSPEAVAAEVFAALGG